MFDEANSLCTTSNLPLSARVATKGLLSATVPSAEATLGCIHEREQRAETLKHFPGTAVPVIAQLNFIKNHRRADKAAAKGQDSLCY